MKFKFVFLETKAPSWVNEARSEYQKKISPFVPLELRTLKSPSAERDERAIKRTKEGRLLLKEFEPKDLVILFDEKGKLARSSEEFSEKLNRVIQSAKSQAVFCIGGAYGFSDEVLARADERWSLSPLTLNHWLAQLAALEQIYRGLTILRGIPYHNR